MSTKPITREQVEMEITTKLFAAIYNKPGPAQVGAPLKVQKDQRTKVLKKSLSAKKTKRRPAMFAKRFLSEKFLK